MGLRRHGGNATDPWVDGLPLANFIGDQGAKALGEALKATTTLTSLGLWGK